MCEAEAVWNRYWFTRFGRHHGNKGVHFKSQVRPSPVTQAASHTLLASIPLCGATVTAALSSALNMVRAQSKVVLVAGDKKHLWGRPNISLKTTNSCGQFERKAVRLVDLDSTSKRNHTLCDAYELNEEGTDISLL